MGLIIGVDGGGTNSIYKVFNPAENKIHEFAGTSINFYSVGDEKACGAFNEVMSAIENSFSKKTDVVYIGNSALGIGDELAPNHPFLQNVSSYADNYKVVSDLYIGLKGVASVPSIFLISGTGSMGIAEDESGKFYTIGGWGHLLGDQGSGYYIGMRGIREAIKAYDGLAEKTILLEKLKKFFAIDKLEDIIEKAYNPTLGKDIIAGFAVEVIESAREGDQVSMDIVNAAVQYLVNYVLRLREKMNNENVIVAVHGGCFKKSNFFYKLFINSVSRYGKNIIVQFPKYNPAESALILAGSLAGVKIPENLFSEGVSHE